MKFSLYIVEHVGGFLHLFNIFLLSTIYNKKFLIFKVFFQSRFIRYLYVTVINSNSLFFTRTTRCKLKLMRESYGKIYQTAFRFSERKNSKI